MDIKTDNYTKEGLYIHFDDGTLLDFSRENIQRLGEEYWSNPSKLPKHIKDRKDLKTCNICPYRGQDVFCSAMKPLLPFIEQVDKFNSHDRVTAVCRMPDGAMWLSKTTLQTALQYVSNLALFEYCEDAKAFHRFFQGVAPFMNSEEACARILLNVYWHCEGKREETKKLIFEMVDHVSTTSASCIKRLQSMCQSDSFANAYVKTHVLAQMLKRNIEKETGGNC